MEAREKKCGSIVRMETKETNSAWVVGSNGGEGDDVEGVTH
jgi:hypothetical protein